MQVSRVVVALACLAAAPLIANPASAAGVRGMPRLAARKLPPRPPVAPPPAVEPATALVMTCLIGPNQPVGIQPDPMGPTHGVMVNDVEHMAWIPAQNQLRMRFLRSTVPSGGDLKPGSCALEGRAMTSDEPDEVAFDIDMDSWQYGFVNNQPVLMPAGSKADVMLTPGSKVVFSVTVRRPSGQTAYWWSAHPPELGQ